MHHAAQNIDDKRDKADHRQHETNRRRDMHSDHRGVDLAFALVVYNAAALDDLIKHTDQRRQRSLYRCAIIFLRGGGVVGVQLQRLLRRTVQLLMQRLQIAAQTDYLSVLRARFTVQPLAENTRGRVHASRKLRARIHGVAEVCRPLVVRRFGGLRGGEQGARRLGFPSRR